MTRDRQDLVMAIVVGGLLAGAMDATSAIAGAVGRGQTPMDMFRYIASGLIGAAARDGGIWTGLLGIAVHFTLTTLMAAGFVLMARRKPELLDHPLLSGMAYGALLYGLMFYVIVPHTGAPHWKQPSGFWANLSAAMGHGCFVGVPIALTARRAFSGRLVAVQRPVL